MDRLDPPLVHLTRNKTVSAKWRTAAIALLVVGTIQWLTCLARGEEPRLVPGAEPTLGTGSFAKPPSTIKELIEQQLGPIRMLKPPFVIRRCKWPCERSA